MATLRNKGKAGFDVCRTPIQSPQSNGMAEAFVKTFKRDYVLVNARPDAMTTMATLAKWFDDYNEHHPHKALNMQSPREYRRAMIRNTDCPDS
jgi:putative transposase